ncbi:MAG: HAD family phosphatase [Lautropia sp.]|nr:HAD family phosphatase [Lautropia sp.]
MSCQYTTSTHPGPAGRSDTQHVPAPELALPHPPAAVIFDMDGLLLDSERVIAECFAATAEAQGAELPADIWLHMIGKSDPVCREMLTGYMGEARARQLLDIGKLRYAERARAGIPHRPGVVELLDFLVRHDIPRAVGTTTRQPLASQKLAAAGLLGYFEVVVSSSDVARPKPAPDTYLRVAEQLGVEPARCLVLEDSPTGVRAALAAGMTPIQIPDLLVPDETVRALGHRIVVSLIDVQQLLAGMLAR